MRVRWKALIPVLGIIGVWLASPEALNLVPDQWSHVLLAVSSLIAVLTPALLTNRPKMDRVPHTTAQRIEKAGAEPVPDAPDAAVVPPRDYVPAKEKGAL